MTAEDVLLVARSAGIRLESRGDTLHVEAPAGVLTPEFRRALVTRKAEILAALAPMEYVTLKGGLTLPMPAIRLALDLEARGIPLQADTDHQFLIPNHPRLTADDRLAIARWRDALAAMVEYPCPEIG